MKSLSVPKKIAMINDIAGYGRCSTTVAIPVISAMKVQVCPVPTSIFSNHTGFPIHFMEDLTEQMPGYLKKWEELNLHFDGIYCGFLGCVRQAEIVADFICKQKQDHSRPSPSVLIDPVMGDHGKAYRTVTKDHCQSMGKLIRYADIITPNMTEVCLLTDTAYKPSGWSRQELSDMAAKLHDMGPGQIVMTGIFEHGLFTNIISEKKPSGSVELSFVSLPSAGPSRHGTGDIFASILAADAVKGTPLPHSVERAASFISACIQGSIELNIPEKDGVCLENFLSLLMED